MVIARGGFFLPAQYPYDFLFQLISSLFFVLHFYSCILLSIDFFQGLDLSKRASSLKEEAHQLEVEAQHLEAEGLGKVEAVVAALDVEGFYEILKGATACPSLSSVPPPSKNLTISHPPPFPSNPSGAYR